MIGAKLAGIDIFVTGGIGGVHRGAQETFDVSADLTELGRTPVAVVSSGVCQLFRNKKWFIQCDSTFYFFFIRSNRSWILAKRWNIWKRKGFAWLLWDLELNFLHFSLHSVDFSLLIGWKRRPKRPVSSSNAWLSTVAADCSLPFRSRNRARPMEKRSNEL